MSQISIWQLINTFLGIGGLSAMIWVIVDWARKDERLTAMNKRITDLEHRVDKMEEAIQTKTSILDSLSAKITTVEVNTKEMNAVLLKVAETVSRMEGRQETMERLMTK